MGVASPGYTHRILVELARIIQAEIPDLREVKPYPPAGNEVLAFPGCHLELDGMDPVYATTDLLDLKWDVAILFYVQGATEEQSDKQIHDIADSLVKLLSGNARGDMGAGRSGKYQSHSGFWYLCEFGRVSYYREREPGGLARGGEFRVRLVGQLAP